MKPCWLIHHADFNFKSIFLSSLMQRLSLVCRPCALSIKCITPSCLTHKVILHEFWFPYSVSVVQQIKIILLTPSSSVWVSVQEFIWNEMYYCSGSLTDHWASSWLNCEMKSHCLYAYRIIFCTEFTYVWY